MRVLLVARTSTDDAAAQARLQRIIHNADRIVGQLMQLNFQQTVDVVVVGAVLSAVVPRFANPALEPATPATPERSGGRRLMDRAICYTYNIRAALAPQRAVRFKVIVGLDGFTCRLDRLRDFCGPEPHFFFIIRARFFQKAIPSTFSPLLSTTSTLYWHL